LTRHERIVHSDGTLGSSTEPGLESTEASCVPQTPEQGQNGPSLNGEEIARQDESSGRTAHAQSQQFQESQIDALLALPETSQAGATSSHFEQRFALGTDLQGGT
jgi:hypothetical protein